MPDTDSDTDRTDAPGTARDRLDEEPNDLPLAASDGPDESTDRLFELWEPERLRRQIVIFESALAAEIASTSSLRDEVVELQDRCDALSTALDDAWEHIELLRRQGKDVSESAQHLREENAVLSNESADVRAKLDEIIGSRAWRWVTRYRALLHRSHR